MKLCKLLVPFSLLVGFTTKDVVYKWVSKKASEAVEMDKQLTTSEFDLGDIRIFEATTVYKTGTAKQLKLIINDVKDGISA